MPNSDLQKRKEYSRNHYLNNKEKYLLSQKRAAKRTKDYIWSLKSNLACIVCGEKDPDVLDFHHRDPSKKELTAANMIRDKWSSKRIDAEISKCDVLCANHHRKLHATQRRGEVFNYGQ